MAAVVIDSSVLVGLLDQRDNWHGSATRIQEALAEGDAEVIYLDCVLNEAISVLARRTHEQKRQEQLDVLLDRLSKSVPKEQITWVSGEIERLYDEIVELVRSSGGALNFHDALIALICRDRGLGILASFDQDFDQINWLIRVGDEAAVKSALRGYDS